MEDKLYKYLQIETRSIVLLGNFSPSLYQPFWIRSKNLIGEEEAKTAKIDLITSDFCQFHIGDWLDFTVMRDKMELRTRKNPYFPLLKDLVSQILRANIEVQITAIGLNYIYSLELADKDKYYLAGKNLGILSNWDNIVHKPTLKSITIQSEIDDRGFISSYNILPSPKELKLNFGIDININNHFSDNNSEMNGLKAAQIIEDCFESYSIQSKDISNKITEKFLSSK